MGNMCSSSDLSGPTLKFDYNNQSSKNTYSAYEPAPKSGGSSAGLQMSIDDSDVYGNASTIFESFEPAPKSGGSSAGLQMSINDSDVYGNASTIFESFVIDHSLIIVGEKIDEGTFGVVTSGLFNGRKVAIKSLKENTAEPDLFVKEISTMAQLNHPNLLQLIGFTLNPIMLISEFVNSGNLHNYISLHVVPLPILTDFALQSAVGLKYLSDHGLFTHLSFIFE